ncbi:MAG: OprO/OprP family phosphate-selective porin [Isosphaeraceae bacterium]
MNRPVVLFILAASVGSPSVIRAEGPPTASAVEERLRALEAMNHRLLLQYEEIQRRESEGRRIAEERYQDLERRYLELQGRIERPEAAPESTGPTPHTPTTGWGEGPVESTEERPEPRALLHTYFDDGFVIGSPDDELTLGFRVLDQTDFKVFMPNDMLPARSGLYIPRVRVYFEGRLTKPFEYEVSLQRSVEGVWDLLDANLDMGSSDAFKIQFGRMLVPYSYDWYDHLEQYFITPERGLFPLNFGLSRAAGLLAHGYLFEDRLQYAIGGFDGRLSGLADNNTARDAVAYLNTRPFLTSERFPALRYLNLGGSIFGGSQALPETPLPLRTSLQSSENDEAARAASATFLEFEPDVAALGTRSALALHLAWYYRRLSMEAEWQSGRLQYGWPHEPPARFTVPVTGYHATLGYFLTGEQVEGRGTVKPLRPFDLRRGRFGLGAIELFARYSQLDLGDVVFEAELANAAESTRHVDMVDVGFNWYPNQFVKFYVDWQLPYFGSPVLVNPVTDVYSRSAALFWLRCQIYF